MSSSQNLILANQPIQDLVEHNKIQALDQPDNLRTRLQSK